MLHCEVPFYVHFLVSSWFQRSRVKVRLGEHNYSAVSNVVQEFEPAEILVHENYKTFRRGNDIALIKLSRKVVFTGNLKPPKLDTIVSLNAFVL